MTKSDIYLLDANDLIALVTPDHVSHERAQEWFLPGKSFATCPITQGALIRFYFRLADQPNHAECQEPARPPFFGLMT